LAEKATDMEVRQDTAITWNWFRMNVPTIVTVLGAFLFVAYGIRDAANATASLKISIDKIEQAIVPLHNLEYRLTRAEDGLKDINSRVDNLSNAMINNVDLIRRDVNRLTTQVEVLSSHILGVEDPKQRRSRPGGPIPVE
jgi:hypothetical protein